MQTFLPTYLQIEVTIAGVLGGDPVTCSRNVKIVPDVALASVADRTYDLILLPGGLKVSDS